MVVPFAIDVLSALIAIDCNTAGVMVSVSVFEVTPPWVALMLVKPTPTPMARPAALMLAMVSSEELQVAVLVRSCVLPSLKVPRAVNGSLVPFAIEVFGALTTIDCSAAGVIVRVSVFEVTPS